ncbi:unnamed protein product [Closterium sp. Naga37s-1]|nr:unnamed protein product [Closterium sp. Naga37s-1]
MVAGGPGAAGGPAGVGAAGGAGAAGPGGARLGGTGAAGGPAGVGAAGGAGAAGPGGARTRGTGGAGASGAAGVGAGGAGAVAAGGAAGAGAVGGAAAGGAAGVVARDPGAQGTGAVSAVSGGAVRPRPYYVPLLQQRPPPVPGTHYLTLRPSTAPQRVPLPSPPASSLPDGPDPESDSLRAASPTVTRFLATVVSDPSFESTAASALVAELVDFAAACRLDYAASLVAESESVCPPSVGGECALGTDVLEDRQEDFECFAAALPHLVSMLLAPEGDPDAPDIPTPRSYAEAIEGPYSSQWQTAMDAEMAFWNSTGTYLDEGSLHEEIWLRRPPGFTGSFPAGTQWSLQRPVYGLRQAPREWHDTLRTTLAALGFAPSTADPSLFLRTDTTLPPFYVLVYVDDRGTRPREVGAAEETHVHRPG